MQSIKWRTLAIAAAALTASCDAPETVNPMAGHDHSASAPTTVRLDSDLANRVRAATARFHSQAQAAAAGYGQESPCIAHPSAGGMGYHWINIPLVDPAFDAGRPEAILYDEDGKLVGVEYIVINAGQTAPTFGGQAFDVGGAPLPVPHWTLHVWLFEENSSGLFAPFNPAVVCD
jgi:hypothetical protein